MKTLFLILTTQIGRGPPTNSILEIPASVRLCGHGLKCKRPALEVVAEQMPLLSEAENDMNSAIAAKRIAVDIGAHPKTKKLK